jgi:hypothetical protein
MSAAPARAIQDPESTPRAPARAIRGAETTEVPPARAKRLATPIHGSPARASERTEPRDRAPARAKRSTNPKADSPARVDVLSSIRTLGRLLDDLEHARKQNGNRIGALEREYGSALPALAVVQDGLAGVEHQAVLQLRRMWRQHPLAQWQAETHGLGEKLMARLIAEIGDPYIASPHHWHEGTLIEDDPYERTVSQLWQYCGHGNPHLKRRAGMSQDEAFMLGKARAKSIVHLISEGLIKARNPEYRAVYDAARAAAADRNHERACAQCHAKPGDPWRPGHQHAHALRLVGKEFLKALWIEARAGHAGIETHACSARAGQTASDNHASRSRADEEIPA